MKPLSSHNSFMIKLRQMKYTKVVLELRDSCLKSNYMHKTVQMTQSFCRNFPGLQPAQLTTRNH